MIRIHVFYKSGTKLTYDLVDRGDEWLTQMLIDSRNQKGVLRAFALRETK
jgi:hypothetical protein